MPSCASPGSYSNYAEEKILGHVLKINGWSSPVSLQAALGSPSGDLEAGSFLEVSQAGYARKKIYFVGPPTTDGSGVSSVKSDQKIVFGPARVDWATVNTLAIFSGNDLITWAPLVVNTNVLQDQQLIITAEQIETALTQASGGSGRWSQFLQESVLKHVFCRTAYATTDSIKAALSDTLPTFDDSATDLVEPADAAYSRPAVNGWGSPTDQGAGTGKLSTVYPCAPFGTATVNWFGGNPADIVAFVDEHDHLLFYGSTSISQSILAGELAVLGQSSCGLD